METGVHPCLFGSNLSSEWTCGVIRTRKLNTEACLGRFTANRSLHRPLDRSPNLATVRMVVEGINTLATTSSCTITKAIGVEMKLRFFNRIMSALTTAVRRLDADLLRRMGLRQVPLREPSLKQAKA